jgi:hypothetical protein
MSDWPQYESHKIVRAAKIVRVDHIPASTGVVVSPVRISITVDPGNGELEQFEPTVPGMAEKAEVGGYGMLYPDGFKSISPRTAFEEGYTRVEP